MGHSREKYLIYFKLEQKQQGFGEMVSCATEHGFGDMLMITLQGCIMGLHAVSAALLRSCVCSVKDIPDS